MENTRHARPIERKEDTPPDITDTKKAIDSVMAAFEAFKSTNDERLGAIEKKGGADPLVDEKLDRIEKTLVGYEDLNAKMTLAEETKKAQDKIQDRFDALETAFKRSPLGGSPDKRKHRGDVWGKAVVSANALGIANLPDEQKQILEEVTAEFKALNVSTDTAGGYLAPAELVLEIIKAETEMSPVRSLARVRQTSQKSVEVPKRTGTFAAQWVAEQGAKSETTGLTYGLEEIPTHEFYAIVDVSNQMMEDAAFDMNGEISIESSEQFSVAEGTAFVSGSGVGRPEGFMSNSDVGTTNSGAATTVTADGLLSLKYAIKTAYTANANFVMNRTTLGSVRKLKDTTNQYLWMPGLAQGRPNTIDGDPYIEMTDMPSEGAGLKPVAYGDFRRAYTWIDRIQMEMMRDPFTQATSGNVRFIMRKRVGGQVVLAEAIRTLTCSA